MDAVAGGSFSNWASGLMSSACSNSCYHKQHYHRHCSCALHSIDNEFTGSSLCSPSSTVKLSGKASHSGMFRSISVQNFGEKRYSVVDDDSASAFDFDSVSSYPSPDSAGTERLPSAEVLALVQELASFIRLVRGDEDSGSPSLSHEGGEIGEICADRMIVDDEGAASSPQSTASFESDLSWPLGSLHRCPCTSPIDGRAIEALADSALCPAEDAMLPEELAQRLLRSETDYLQPLRLPMMEKRGREGDVALKTQRFSDHRRRRSYGW